MQNKPCQENSNNTLIKQDEYVHLQIYRPQPFIVSSISKKQGFSILKTLKKVCPLFHYNITIIAQNIYSCLHTHGFSKFGIFY